MRIPVKFERVKYKKNEIVITICSFKNKILLHFSFGKKYQNEILYVLTREINWKIFSNAKFDLNCDLSKSSITDPFLIKHSDLKLSDGMGKN